MANKSAVAPHGVSTAMDARLETGVQLAAELKLKVRARDNGQRTLKHIVVTF